MKEKSNSTKRSMKITTNYPVENEPVDKNSFAKLIREKRRDLKEDSGKVISTKALGDMLDISYELFRKILNQEKPTKKRDCIIAICIALNLTPGEINYALSQYQYMPGLDMDNPRDKLIFDQAQNPSITIEQLV